MDKELEELMQIKVVSENKTLSNMIEDIIPVEKVRFTDLELEVNKKQEFSLIVYKKGTPFMNFFRGIKLFFEKLQIMKHSREFSLVKVKGKEIK